LFTPDFQTESVISGKITVSNSYYSIIVSFSVVNVMGHISKTQNELDEFNRIKLLVAARFLL
jgi:hypothetical protein